MIVAVDTMCTLGILDIINNFATEQEKKSNDNKKHKISFFKREQNIKYLHSICSLF